MSAHTQGAWRFEECGDNWYVLASGETRPVYVANVPDLRSHSTHGWDVPKEDERVPNAHLIAAAPDLYSACKSLLAAGQGRGTSLVDAFDAIKAAVAKAEGAR